jgi:hypothetical protein
MISYSGALLLLLFVFFYLVILVQRYGTSGDAAAKAELNKYNPVILTSGAAILGGGLLYLLTRTAASPYDRTALTALCLGAFALSVITFHSSLYKVDLS